MVLRNPENAIRLQGTLIKGADDLTAAYPYGGTVLGLISSGRFLPNMSSKSIKVEEWGNTVFDVLQAPQTAFIMGVLRSFDRDCLKTIFPTTVTGTSGDEYVKMELEQTSAGNPFRVSTNSFKLLFAPVDDLNPFIVFYNAMPMVKEGTEISLSKNDEMQMGVVFQAVSDSSNKVYQWGKKEDISL